MNSPKNLYGTFLTSGFAQLFNALFSIIKIKGIALILGPIGIGIFGILQNFQQLIQQISNMGLNSSGVRYIANEPHSKERLSKAFFVLGVSNTFFGLVSMFAILFFSKSISYFLFGNEDHIISIFLIAISVFLFQISTVFSTIFQGRRDISSFSLMIWVPTLVSSLFGTLIIYKMEFAGLGFFFIIQAIASTTIGTFLLFRSSLLEEINFNSSRFLSVLKPMITMGFTFMLGGMVSLGSILGLRAYILNVYGATIVGEFAAAWTIASSYLGIYIATFAADYFPRLAAYSDNNKGASQCVNKQLQQIIIIGTPILVTLYLAAPYLVQVLYASDFTSSAQIIRDQNLGNFFKLASWSLGLMFAASGLGMMFLGVQVLFNFIFILTFYLLQHYFGFLAIGYAFSFAYFLHLIIVFLSVRLIREFRLSSISILVISFNSSIILVQYFQKYLLNYEDFNINLFFVMGCILTNIIFYQKFCASRN